MENLKQLLLQEQERLERIVFKTEEQLKNAPPGSLSLSCSKKWMQYYHRVPGEKGRGNYIQKKEQGLIRQLAQKSYDEKVLKLAEKRLQQIRSITRDYAEDEIEKIFFREHRERQRMIRPVEEPWESQLDRWMAEEYQGKPFKEDVPVILTEQGERVRSKSEKILADFFYHQGIPYKYEHPLFLQGFGVIYPDFTFLSRRTRQEIYWEHDGKMDDPVYAQSAVRKIELYVENNIYPGERLILTYETEKTVLNTRILEKLAVRYLL